MPDAIINDTALIATCNAAAAAHDAYHAVCAETDGTGSAGWKAQHLAAERRGELLDQIEVMPAATPAGLRAKAGIVARVHQFHGNQMGEGLLRSLLADLGAEVPTD